MYSVRYNVDNDCLIFNQWNMLFPSKECKLDRGKLMMIPK